VAKARGPAREFGLTDLPPTLRGGEGWATLRAALAAGRSGTIDGAWGSAAAAAVAALTADAPVLAVVPSLADIDPWTEDLTSFTGTRPAVFPAQETWPPVSTRGLVSDETGRRLRVLQQLLTRPPQLILAPMASVVQPVPPREDFAAGGRRLKVGETIDLDELTAWLAANGYKRTEAVEFAGEFGRRGGICDLFPPDDTDPVRLEFFGDELESIRTFSAQTQRSLGSADEIRVLSLTAGRERPANGFITDYLPSEAVVALVSPTTSRNRAVISSTAWPTRPACSPWTAPSPSS